MAKRPKGRVILVSIVPKIPARWRQMDFCIFCEKFRQYEKNSIWRENSNCKQEAENQLTKRKHTADNCKQIAEIS